MKIFLSEWNIYYIQLEIICIIMLTGGKRDKILILPINDSISATLDTEQVIFSSNL